MSNNGNGSITHNIYTHSADDLESILRMIRQSRLTGGLTINFSQGVPAGTMEWRERARNATSSIPSPMLSLVRDNKT